MAAVSHLEKGFCWFVFPGILSSPIKEVMFCSKAWAQVAPIQKLLPGQLVEETEGCGMGLIAKTCCGRLCLEGWGLKAAPIPLS